ncbi:Translin [Blyttiomyces helicus]|uniref:Translin n=1 Tax=Blyttiomyces helicus TaxID=388810 RepID=A0A4P9WBG4_9FUNG|nr:Translin [Blyttiomyces helicus]|eukprot:RKO89824.1 Translin [Blyttiomyces helicus]
MHHVLLTLPPRSAALSHLSALRSPTSQDNFDSENTIREEMRGSVRDLERTCREVASVLAQVHSAATEQAILAIASTASDGFDNIRKGLKALAAFVPQGQFYRYSNMFVFTLQQAVQLATFVIYLQTERLITVEELQAMLGGDVPEFHIGVDDMLHGMVPLTGELARFAMNRVTYGDYTRPLRISKFVADLHAGFQLLNLRNDSLRKRFDGMKYDCKRIEEIVYDISLRRLATNVEKTDA